MGCGTHGALSERRGERVDEPELATAERGGELAIALHARDLMHALSAIHRGEALGATRLLARHGLLIERFYLGAMLDQRGGLVNLDDRELGAQIGPRRAGPARRLAVRERQRGAGPRKQVHRRSPPREGRERRLVRLPRRRGERTVVRCRSRSGGDQIARSAPNR